MNIDLTDQEVRLIKKLLKRELTHSKTEIKLVKIFDLQNKLNVIGSSLQLKEKEDKHFEAWLKGFVYIQESDRYLFDINISYSKGAMKYIYDKRLKSNL